MALRLSSAPHEHRLWWGTLGATGVIHIKCRQHSGEPSKYLASFGGNKDGVGAFSFGRAFGIVDWIRLLPKVGLSQGEIDTALEVLKAHSHHEIQNVSLRKGFLRSLGS